MSLHFSANQFQDSYMPQRLGNWQVAKTFPERPRARQGITRPITDVFGRFKDDFSHKSSSRNLADTRYQSAPLPVKCSNPLFISGSAVASAKPMRSFKGNQRKGAETGSSSLKIQNYFPPGKDEPKNATNNHNQQNPQEEQDEAEQIQTQPTTEGSSLRPEGFFLIKPALPDDPRKAAVLLAARQKNHRPLPDVNVESRDALIPRNWNDGIQPSAVTVDTSKAKGPTACTKRHVVRLNANYQPIERRPNVMELAIKWEAKTPPSSAGKAVRTKAAAPPVEKTLYWLYENPSREESSSRSTSEKKNKTQKDAEPVGGVQGSASEGKWAAKKEDSAKSRDSGVSLRSRASNAAQRDICAERNGAGEGGGYADGDSDQESGYNSPRSSRDHQEAPGSNLYDLDPVKITRKSLSPPKNHFIVSSAFNAKMNRGDPDANYLPEYPLQRRDSPRPQRAVLLAPQVSHSGHCSQANYVRHRRGNINEYPPQRSPTPPLEQYVGREEAYHHATHHETSYPSQDLDQHQPDCQLHSLPTNREEADHHNSHGGATVRYVGDQDSGFGDREQDDQSSHPRHFSQHSHDKCIHRARPCLACEHSVVQIKAPAPSQTFKSAFKAGAAATKTVDDLNQIMKRRNGYKAPKPPPLTSHARFVRGTLVPPLSIGCRTDPVVQYPDFKRLDSTYRISYGAHHHQPQHHQTQHHRHRPKTLTALLNEKSSRVWKH